MKKIMINSENLVTVTNNTEYYQNGNVKAYTSSLYHEKLIKTINVRNRDHAIYTEKFDQAFKLLNLEWKIVCKNKNIAEFLNKSTKFHILSYYATEFSYKDFVICKIQDIDYHIKTPDYKKEISMIPKPTKSKQKYIFEIKWYHRLFRLVDKKKRQYEELFNSDSKMYNNAYQKNEDIKNENKKIKITYESKVKERENLLDKTRETYHLLYNEYSIAKKKEVSLYFDTLLNYKIEINSLFQKFEFETEFDSDDQILIVNFTFPNENEFPRNKELKLIKSKISYNQIKFKDKEFNELMKSTFYSIYIGLINEIIKLDLENKISNIVLNGFYKGTDKRTGKPFNVCIMTAKVNTKEFKEINLNNIEPKETFKYLAGRGIPDPENVIKVDPIRFFDKSSYRLIDSNEVLSSLTSETNLAAISWQDFETLIKDVFELEFKEQNIEIRNTQHSNDGGIDVVTFNSTAYSEGVILLQAKRYTNIVTPEPVRALKGAMVNHKAIRGILATTSDFGGSSREFAKNNNITLINGDHLLELLKKHGYDFHIDLKQAKLLNQKKH